MVGYDTPRIALSSREPGQAFQVDRAVTAVTEQARVQPKIPQLKMCFSVLRATLGTILRVCGVNADRVERSKICNHRSNTGGV